MMLAALRFVEVDQRILLGLVPVAPWALVASALVAALLHSGQAFAGVAAVSVIAVGLAMPGTVLPRTGCSVQGQTVQGDVVIYSHNVLFGSADEQAILAQIESVDADVVVLQEADAEFVESIGLLLDEYPHRIQRGWQVTFSRWEFAADQQATESDIVGALQVVVNTPAGPLRVVNVHSPWPLKPGGRDVQIQQFDLLSDVLTHNEAMPVVAIGDFNSTPSDARYRALASGDSARGEIADAHRTAGCGFGVGWSPLPGVGPAVLSIDHTVVSGAQVESYEVLDYAGGDHKGIAVHVSLENT